MPHFLQTITPEIPFPDSHNAGDFGQFLVGAEHAYAKTKEELEKRTDGHMDINKVRPGAVVICPVKVKDLLRFPQKKQENFLPILSFHKMPQEASQSRCNVNGRCCGKNCK